ncbi:MAG: ribokinase [Fimbriimonadaceae bacterium]
MARVYVVGSANMDLMVRADRFPNPGETVLGSAFETFPGGKGANQAVAAGKLGADVRFIGKVGSDSFGEILAQSLRSAGVDVSALARDPDIPGGVAAIVVDASGQNQIVVVRGANARVTADEVRSGLAGLTAGDVVLVQLETNISAVEAALAAGPPGVVRVFNPAPAPSEPLPESVFTGLDFITPNETETHMLTGILPVDEESRFVAASALLKKGVRNVVLTLGADGCYWQTGPDGPCEAGTRLPAEQVQAVDTVAAGDAFNGALAAFLSEGKPAAEAIRWALKAATISVTRPGAQPSMPTRDEVLGSFA